jgi:hypothetical protein
MKMTAEMTMKCRRTYRYTHIHVILRIIRIRPCCSSNRGGRVSPAGRRIVWPCCSSNRGGRVSPGERRIVWPARLACRTRAGENPDDDLNHTMSARVS